MAITGFLLFSFVVVHLLGNLQIFLGLEPINRYALLLKAKPLLLWSFRIGLLTIAVLHIATGISLAMENRRARPEGYVAGKAPYASLSSRTMLLSGLILLVFIIFHLLHFTVGVIHPSIMGLIDPYGRVDVFNMVVRGFRVPWISLFYVGSMALLYFHLSHGISSLFQSLGLKSRNYSGFILGFAHGAAFLLFLGNCSIPIAILLGFVK